ASDEDDVIKGNGRRDVIFGGAGNDKLYGGSGNDELHGGTGNDYLNGGNDNDTYVFELGDGNDTINEERAGGTDKVLFGEGITADDVVVTRDGNDMVLLVGNDGDTLRITSQFTDYYNRIENFEFADGTVKTMADYYAETITMNVSGEYSDPDDYATGTTVINASDEDDVIKGNGRRDVIFGGAGNDKLYGGSGNDELHGGTGNDYLNGGNDNDTYVFELGDGNDTINEERAGGTDKVLFGEGITEDDVVVTRDGNDMVLLVGNDGDTLRITSQFTDYYSRIENFEFADGTVKTMADYYAETITMNVSGEYSDPDDYATGTTVINASDKDDVIKGNGRRDVIFGGAGDDKLYGGNGNDELHGGTGNDYLNGGND
ncbi:calcium-binding protein, partial [Ruminococcus flavefaciens]|uniref:calcium-binding protein n=1 Tax=Ruminococcus flavefaciens TaxID=1265 RepID=UPI0023B81CD6